MKKMETSLRLAPAQKRVLADEVADVLRAAILDGRLEPEQQILESHVADMMQVSRGPVREALSRLEQEGLVYKVRNRGTFVARLSREDVEEVCSLRQALELLAVQYFLRNATLDDVARLEEIISTINKLGLEIITLHIEDMPDAKEREVCVHLRSYNVTQLLKELKAKGYKVKARQR